jgi:fumarylacetoacetase
MSIATLDETHDPVRRSWVATANAPGADFPLQNLPLGVFRTGAAAPGIGVAIGGSVLDLRAAVEVGALRLSHPVAEASCAARLNALMALGAGPRSEEIGRAHV